MKVDMGNVKIQWILLKGSLSPYIEQTLELLSMSPCNSVELVHLHNIQNKDCIPIKKRQQNIWCHFGTTSFKYVGGKSVLFRVQFSHFGKPVLQSYMS